jgi:hypothetical protein
MGIKKVAPDGEPKTLADFLGVLFVTLAPQSASVAPGRQYSDIKPTRY